MGPRWWREVANRAVVEAASSFSLTCQLELGVMRLEDEVAEVERLGQERLVAVDGEVMKLPGRLTKIPRQAAPRATLDERADIKA